MIDKETINRMKEGKEPIRLVTEKGIIRFCIVVLVILLCGILQFRS